MGGFGSGRSGSRRKAEHCLSLDVNMLHRHGCLKAGYFGGCDWSRNGRVTGGISISSDGLAIVLSFNIDECSLDVEQLVPLAQVPCTKGGSRSYFRCTGHPNGEPCGRRVGKLFLAQRYFLCRHCQRIAYTSQSEPQQERLYRKGNKMRGGLGGVLGLFSPIPKRPKGMHHQTYEHRLGQLRQIEDRASSQLSAEIVGLLVQIRPSWRDSWARLNGSMVSES